MVHRLECDHGELLVDGELREFFVLHTVRPPPQNLPNAQPGDVAEQRLGLQDDVALLDELLASPEAGDPALQLVVGHAETLPVATFEVDAVPEIIRNPTEVVGMQRKPTLMLLKRAGHDAETQLVHAVPSAQHRVLRPGDETPPESKGRASLRAYASAGRAMRGASAHFASGRTHAHGRG